MRKIVFLAMATMGSSLFVASPSLAQPQFQFGIGPDGRPQFGVRDPEQERYERRERWRERREEDRARAYEEGRRDALRDERRYGGYESRCRNIIIREEDDWGRTVTRRVRRCD
ncbi:hypothetical protein [Microvirga mediterraneensis]|uniref:Uncharacterized protein n=1 Tax=Microvirga mediterraneensis TaxID=2754695 RepID=A0A838BHL5_9HYPH|nr:hypothetical protein [Microvirga mediterraneensis]MBA1155030.1 hypothetical protein [Microvirga mediterraneensis]